MRAGLVALAVLLAACGGSSATAPGEVPRPPCDAEIEAMIAAKGEPAARKNGTNSRTLIYVIDGDTTSYTFSGGYIDHNRTYCDLSIAL